MAGHIEVVKLIAEISVVSDAGEDVEEKFDDAEGD
jgi:hypothetical protein